MPKKSTVLAVYFSNTFLCDTIHDTDLRRLLNSFDCVASMLGYTRTDIHFNSTHFKGMIRCFSRPQIGLSATQHI